MIIICCLLGCILGATVLYLVLRPKLQATQELDQETARRNAEIQESNVKLNLELKELSTRKESLTDNIHTLQTYADEYYNKNIELANERFETSIMRVAEDYRAREAEYEQEYLTVLSDTSQAFTETIQQHKDEIFELTTKLTHLRSAVNAAVEAAKRRAEEETQRDFYRLQLSDTDVSEIRKLREVLPYLRDKEPLNKVIYKVYYEKPYTDFIGRV
jgi:chromosome segregation ATPase